MSAIRTVILPVAGKGTRLLPATKSVPKELLPIFDKPLLQFAIEEAIEAQAERLVFVTSPDKQAIRDYVAESPALREKLISKNASELVSALEATEVTKRIDTVFVDQNEPLGLGHAVNCARDHVLDGPVGVILPDDLILGPPCFSEMAQAYTTKTCGYLVAAMEVEPEETGNYGIFRTAGHTLGPVVATEGMVEKPNPGDAPSRLAAVGRYILPADVFQHLSRIGRGAGGEIQLTDAIEMGREADGLSAYLFKGTRYDCGSKDGLLAANIAYGSAEAARNTPLAAE